MEFDKRDSSARKPVRFDGVLETASDSDFDLFERIAGAIGDSLPAGHPLRDDPLIKRFCRLAERCNEAADKLPGLEWQDGRVAGSRPAAPDLEAATRSLAYQFAALLPLAHEAARILEQAGIKVYSRDIPR